MGKAGNIIIADRSALHLLLHCDIAARANHSAVSRDPLDNCMSPREAPNHFNIDNALYGNQPIDLLVSNAGTRTRNKFIDCHYVKSDLPAGSFLELREGLYVMSPELTFARMANYLTSVQLVEVGTNLCAQYYIDLSGTIQKRDAFQTSVSKLRKYLESVPNLKGRAKALRALRYVKDNSASPMETKTMIVFCLPLNDGGFNLPFEYMNYDIKIGRNASLVEQSRYCVDLASTKFLVALEFDGTEFHVDSGHDKRRRNALVALGWTVFCFEKDVLLNPAATETCALQIAKHIGYRMQRQKTWDKAYIDLRRELGLGV